MAPSAAALLTAWESAAAEDPLYRAPSLLHSLGLLEAETRLEEMPVGRCDAHLFELRRTLFGDQLELTGSCPACATDTEMSVSVADLHPPVASRPPPDVAVRKNGYSVSCRVPVNGDLGEMASLGSQATPNDLLERCLLAATSPEQDDVSVGELPSAVVEAVIEAMAESDPGARTELVISCPCGADWTEELDIRGVVWAEVTDWVGRTLADVHRLAHSYGWTEADILRMPAWRRRWYLEAAGW
jgi:hypothetical protein